MTERRDLAAVVLANFHDPAEELLLGVVEDLAAIARGEPLFQSHGQRDQRGLVWFGQVAMQMRQVVGIADGDDFLLAAVESELLRDQLTLIDQFEVELLGLLAIGMLDVALDTLRDRKDHEESKREDDA